MLGNVNFRRYWLSNVLNSFGGQVGALALPLCAVLLLHATPGQMGMLGAASAAPFALFALPAGVWLDRSRKLPIVLASETVVSFSLASIAVAWWLGMLSMPWLYAVGFVLGTCSVLGGGAEQIFLTQLVGRDGLIDAQSKFAVTDSASRLMAPGLAGILIQWLSAPVAMLVNAATLAVSVLNLRRIKTSEARPARSDKHPLREIRDGFAFILSQPLLRALAWGSGIWFILFHGYAALGILFATRELGMSPGMLGAVQTLGGIGVFVSGVLMKPLNRCYGLGVTTLTGLAMTSVAWMLMPTVPAALFGSPTASAIAYGALVLFFDCGVMLFVISYSALRQRVTPDALLGRMVSTMRFLTIAAAPLGALGAGYMAEHFSIRTGLACVGGGGLALTIVLMLSKPIRSVRP